MRRFCRCDDGYENPVSVSTYSSTCFNLLVSRTREASEITSRRRRANIGSYSSRLYGAYVPWGFPRLSSRFPRALATSECPTFRTLSSIFVLGRSRNYEIGTICFGHRPYRNLLRVNEHRDVP